MRTPWGTSQRVDRIAPGIVNVSTASHGGIILDDDHVARIPETIEAGYSGSRHAWEEDCDWAVPYLLFAAEFAAWGCVQRRGADAIQREARATLQRYRPDWLAAIDAATEEVS